MDKRFNLDELFEEEFVKEEPLLLKRRLRFKKNKSLPWFKKRPSKKMISFWILKRKRLNQSPTWKLYYLLSLNLTLVLSIILIWELRWISLKKLFFIFNEQVRELGYLWCVSHGCLVSIFWETIKIWPQDCFSWEAQLPSSKSSSTSNPTKIKASRRNHLLF